MTANPFRVKLKGYFHALELYDSKGAPIHDLATAEEAAERMYGNEWSEVYNGQEGVAREDDPTEPDEDDYTTDDHVHFYQFGKLVVTVPNEDDWRPHVKRHMDLEQFWPNVWWISDHGNPHLLSLTVEN